MFKRKFARTIPDNLRAPHIKMWGFEAKRARKFTRTSPRTLPFFFITMLFSSLIIISAPMVTQRRTRQRLDLLQDQRRETQWEKRQALAIMRECARRQAEIRSIMAAVCRSWGEGTHQTRSYEVASVGDHVPIAMENAVTKMLSDKWSSTVCRLGAL